MNGTSCLSLQKDGMLIFRRGKCYPYKWGIDFLLKVDGFTISDIKKSLSLYVKAVELVSKEMNVKEMGY